MTNKMPTWIVTYENREGVRISTTVLAYTRKSAKHMIKNAGVIISVIPEKSENAATNNSKAQTA